MTARRRRRRLRNGVVIRHEGRLELDHQRAAEILREAVLEEIKALAESGLTRTGAPMPAYDDLYRRRRAEEGLPIRPNLKRTGRFLSSIRGRIRVSKRSGAAKIVIQPTPARRAQGRGLVGMGRDIFGLTARARKRVLRRLREAPVITD